MPYGFIGPRDADARETHDRILQILRQNAAWTTHFAWCEPGEEVVSMSSTGDVRQTKPTVTYGVWKPRVIRSKPTRAASSRLVIRLPRGWLDSDAGRLTAHCEAVFVRAEEIRQDDPNAPEIWRTDTVDDTRLFRVTIVKRGVGANTTEPQKAFAVMGGGTFDYHTNLMTLLRRTGIAGPVRRERNAKARREAAAAEKAAARAAFAPLSEVNLEDMAAAVAAKQAALRAEIMGLRR